MQARRGVWGWRYGSLDALVLFPVAMIKYFDKSKLENKEFIRLTIPDYGPSLWGGRGSRDLNQPATSTGNSRGQYCVPICLCSVPFLHSCASQDSLPREWYHLQWAGLPNSISIVKAISSYKLSS